MDDKYVVTGVAVSVPILIALGRLGYAQSDDITTCLEASAQSKVYNEKKGALKGQFGS